MKRLTLRLERCSGCKRCELACAEEHSGEKNTPASLITGPGPKTRIFVDSINDRPVPVVCRHCDEPLCVSACMSGCMQKDPETGVVTNEGHTQKCVGCWMCIMACPFGVINMSTDGIKIPDEEFSQALKCDFCPGRYSPACADACPNEAIEIESK